MVDFDLNQASQYVPDHPKTDLFVGFQDGRLAYKIFFMTLINKTVQARATKTIRKPDYLSSFRMVNGLIQRKLIQTSLDRFIKKRVIKKIFYSWQNGLVFDHPKTGLICPVQDGFCHRQPRPFYKEKSHKKYFIHAKTVQSLPS